VDTDAHAPEQLRWQSSGYARAARIGLGEDRLVTSWPLDRLRHWTARSGTGAIQFSRGLRP
jgi:putative hydrolase